MKRGFAIRVCFVTISALLSLVLSAAAADTVKIAFIDPMSGPFASTGELMANHFRAAIDEINARGGVLGGKKMELVAFDNRMSPQESLIILKKVSDQGIRFITQGSGSNVAAALSEGIVKIYERTPEKVPLFLNYGATDPELTNDKCNYWFFRFEADADMKLKVLTDYIATQKKIKKVYLVNQDYAHGQGVSRVARKMLAKKRPDIKIVGDDLHPVGKVKDFSPYVAKIKASGADAVISGNWGNDLALLVKAGRDTGLKVDWYTFYAGTTLTMAAGEGATGSLKQITEYHQNIAGSKLEEFARNYEKKYLRAFAYIRPKIEMDMLAKAIDQAKSTDPAKVAKALEGMKLQGDGGEVWMRPDDHQLMMPQYISSMTKAGRSQKVKHDMEGLGLGWKTDAKYSMQDAIIPTTCKMTRP
jgi:branched-chain amino acid transport system substrate-binding protein